MTDLDIRGPHSVIYRSDSNLLDDRLRTNRGYKVRNTVLLAAYRAMTKPLA